MERRTLAKDIIARINALNVHTQYEIRADKLYVAVLGGLTSEQRDLIRIHRDLLYWYLSTPPSTEGMCIRGHTLQWKCTLHGCWLCSCYFLPYASQAKENKKSNNQLPPAISKPSIKGYWQETPA